MPKRKSTAKQPSRSQRKPRAARTERTRTTKQIEELEELESDGVVDAEMEEFDTDRYEIPQWWR